MHVVNYITLSRILLGPLFLLIYSQFETFDIPFNDVPYYLFLLLAISEFTDLVDGFLARRYAQVSDFGKIIDPMADTIFRISVFLSYTLSPVNLPMWIVFLILYRELIISSLRTICALKGFALAARSSGKIKAVVLGIASLVILVLLFFYVNQTIGVEQLQSYSYVIALTAALYTVITGVEYLYVNRGYLLKALRP